MKTITATIGPDGSLTIGTEGFSGAECEKATAAIEEAFGQTKSNKRTAEFAKTARATVRQQ